MRSSKPTGLERLADRALQRRAREVLVHRLAVDDVRAGAGLEDHAGDRGLALAGRRVAGVGAQVDRDLGDGLLDGLLVGGRELLVGGGLEVLLVAVLRAAGAVLAVDDDVDLEVGARDRGALTRGGRRVVVGGVGVLGVAGAAGRVGGALGRGLGGRSGDGLGGRRVDGLDLGGDGGLGVDVRGRTARDDLVGDGVVGGGLGLRVRQILLVRRRRVVGRRGLVGH
jgi:hypothetical protein